MTEKSPNMVKLFNTGKRRKQDDNSLSILVRWMRGGYKTRDGKYCTLVTTSPRWWLASYKDTNLYDDILYKPCGS